MRIFSRFSSLMLSLVVVAVMALPFVGTIQHAQASERGLYQFQENAIKVVNALIYLDTLQITFDILGSGYTFLPPEVSELCKAVRSAQNTKVTVDCANDEAVAKPYSISVPVMGVNGEVKIAYTYDSKNYPDPDRSSGTIVGNYTGADEVVAESSGSVDDADSVVTNGESSVSSSASGIFSFRNISIAVILIIFIIVLLLSRGKKPPLT